MEPIKILLAYDHGKDAWYDQIDYNSKIDIDNKKIKELDGKEKCCAEIEYTNEFKKYKEFIDYINNKITTVFKYREFFEEKIEFENSQNNLIIDYFNINKNSQKEELIEKIKNPNEYTVYVLNCSDDFYYDYLKFGEFENRENIIFITSGQHLNIPMSNLNIDKKEMFLKFKDLKSDPKEIKNCFYKNIIFPILDRIIKGKEIEVFISFTRRNDAQKSEKEIVNEIYKHRGLKVIYDEIYQFVKIDELVKKIEEPDVIPIIVYNEAYINNYWTKRELDAIKNNSKYCILTETGALDAYKIPESKEDKYYFFNHAYNEIIKENTINDLIFNLKMDSIFKEYKKVENGKIKNGKVENGKVEDGKLMHDNQIYQIISSFDSIVTNFPYIAIREYLNKIFINNNKISIKYGGKIDSGEISNNENILITMIQDLRKLKMKDKEIEHTIEVRKDYFVNYSDDRTRSDLIRDIQILLEDGTLTQSQENIEKFREDIKKQKSIFIAFRGLVYTDPDPNTNPKIKNYIISENVCNEVKGAEIVNYINDEIKNIAEKIKENNEKNKPNQK